MTSTTVSRRAFLGGAGTVVISFSLARSTKVVLATPEQPEDPKLSADRQRDLTPALDGWLRIDEDSQVALYTGKVEIGTGALTALCQIVAEELSVPFEQVSIVSGNTDVVPNQGMTSATATIGVAAVVIRQAAATARQAILETAAKEFNVPGDQLAIRDGVVRTADGSQERDLGALIGGRQFARDVDMEAPVKSPDQYTIVGQPIPRIDIPAKLAGAEGDFIDNTRLDGMTHARLLRAPAYGARLLSYDESVAKVDGIVAVIPITYPGDERFARVTRIETMPGDFIAVVAEREDQALAAIERLRASAEWDAGENLPITHDELYEWVQENGKPIELTPIGDPGTRQETFEEVYQQYETRRRDATDTFAQAYRSPYIAHAPIGSAFSLADVQSARATVWTSSQWPFGTRWMVAEALGFDDETQVRVIGGPSTGLYGRRDDFDQEIDVEAAILSQEIGRPVRLQWSRADEFVWSQYRPPQIVELETLLDENHQITGLHARVHTAVRGVYPLPGNVPISLVDTPYTVRPLPLEGFDAGPLLRTGNMRNVFSGCNMFALESFMDELAARAGADPIEYRLRHLEDERAIEVINAAAALAGWQPSGGNGGTGMGISFALYTNANGPSSAYMAYIAEVEVDEGTGEYRVTRFSCAIDPGLVVNPDGVRNQVEGGVIQATSWATKEQVEFNRSIVTSHDWATYPILTFPEVPEIEVTVINRKDQPPKGVGEPVTVPVAAAIANAIYDATGARVRTLPLTPERVKDALASPTATPPSATPAG
jgi:CO/xanthine dehydrogenase Mo-binding subunit